MNGITQDGLSAKLCRRRRQVNVGDKIAFISEEVEKAPKTERSRKGKRENKRNESPRKRKREQETAPQQQEKRKRPSLKRKRRVGRNTVTRRRE
jgi:hypothetical protein